MKVVAVRNGQSHLFIFTKVAIDFDTEARILNVSIKQGSTDNVEVRPESFDEMSASIDLASLRLRSDWCAHQTYFLSIKDGKLGELFALFPETLSARISAHEFARRTQQSLTVGINVPFEDATDDELFVTVNLNQNALDSDIAVNEHCNLEWSEANSSGTVRTILFPHLHASAPETVSAGETVVASVRIEDASGTLIERDATIYLEAVSGILPATRVTAKAGVATVAVMTTGMIPSDVARVKCGWKYFPGVDDISVKVV